MPATNRVNQPFLKKERPVPEVKTNPGLIINQITEINVINKKREMEKMYKKVTILGKRILPLWLLALLLVACGAGAAVGTVLAGKVTGEVPVSVSQALLTGVPVWLADANFGADSGQPQQVNLHAEFVNIPNRDFGAVADDNTAFQAAAELAVGDWAAFNLPLKNASDNPLIGLLILSVPECLEVEVYADADATAGESPAAATNITEVVRIGANAWKFTLAADAEYDSITDVLTVVVSVDDTCTPGYYNISGEIRQIAY
jgi:hypothetical protein